jgi:septum formation protein
MSETAHRTPLSVILASASPRRRELLSLIGIPHTVQPADIDETAFPDEQPDAHAERLARAKAEVLARTMPEALVIAADTIVVIDGMILGKPIDTGDARRMLARLSDRTHTVVTAIACARRGRVVAAVERVAVTFRPLTAKEIDAYIATGEPMDKAGSYGIQGFGATIVQRIDGDYFAVMGLSLVRLVALMTELGVPYHFSAPALLGA